MLKFVWSTCRLLNDVLFNLHPGLKIKKKVRFCFHSLPMSGQLWFLKTLHRLRLLLIDWLIDWLTEWLTDWLIEIDWFTDRTTDQLSHYCDQSLTHSFPIQSNCPIMQNFWLGMNTWPWMAGLLFIKYNHNVERIDLIPLLTKDHYVVTFVYHSVALVHYLYTLQ